MGKIKGDILMSLRLYKKFIDNMKDNGVQVDKLSIFQLKDSMSLFKAIERCNEQYD